MENRQNQQSATDFDLQNWGLQQIAYLRPSVVDGMRGFGIFSATGEMIGFAVNRNQALGAMIRNELEPVALH
jgi:hypothetical protein